MFIQYTAAAAYSCIQCSWLATAINTNIKKCISSKVHTSHCNYQTYHTVLTIRIPSDYSYIGLSSHQHHHDNDLGRFWYYYSILIGMSQLEFDDSISQILFLEMMSMNNNISMHTDSHSIVINCDRFHIRHDKV